MKSTSTGTLTGCFVWLVTLFVVGSCLCPLAAGIGSVMSQTNSAYVAGIVGPYLCDSDTTPRINTYATTVRDSSGVDRPGIGFELHCLNPDGSLAKNTGATYSYIWAGLFALVGLALAMLLAFALAAPAAALVATFMRRRPAQGGPYRAP